MLRIVATSPLVISGPMTEMTTLRDALDRRGSIKDGQLVFLESVVEPIRLGDDPIDIACWGMVFSGQVTLLGMHSDGALCVLLCEHDDIRDNLAGMGMNIVTNYLQEEVSVIAERFLRERTERIRAVILG